MGSQLQRKTAPPERRFVGAAARPWRIVLAEAVLVSMWIIAVVAVTGTQATDSKSLTSGLFFFSTK